MLMYRHRLDAGPGETSCFDERLAFGYLFDGPYLAVRDVVEGGDDTGGSCHFYVCESNGVVRAVPTHGLNAEIHNGLRVMGYGLWVRY
jgi:hypothetical protein